MKRLLPRDRRRASTRRSDGAKSCSSNQLLATATVGLILVSTAAILPTVTNASPLDCGTILTTPCLSWSDVRYNPHRLTTLPSQNSLWTRAAGRWIVSHRSYGPNGRPKSNAPYNPQGAFPYRRDAHVTYRNVTTTGTRLYVHEIHVYRPPDPSSPECWMSNIPNSPQKHYGDAIAGAGAGETDGGDDAAAAGGGGGGGNAAASSQVACGTHGHVTYRELFGTVSPDKDGSAAVFWLHDEQYGSLGQYYLGAPGVESVVRPIGDDTLHYRIASDDGGLLTTWTDVLPGAADRMEGSGVTLAATYDDDGRSGIDDVTHTVSNATRSTDDDGWVKSLMKALAEANIPDQDRMSLSLRLSTHSDGCLFGQDRCPTDDDFCTLGQDLSCGKTASPYQEPMVGVRYAAVLSLSLICAFAALALGIKAHRHILYTRLTRQELRHRDAFVGQVAKRIDMRTSSSQLSAEELANMVLHIADGLREASPEYRPIIGKEELWEFMASGVAGKMYEMDFDLLFHAIDVQGLGRLDFVDYMVYLSMCGKSFSEVDEGLFDAAVEEEETVERACKRISASWGVDRVAAGSGIGFNFPSM